MDSIVDDLKTCASSLDFRPPQIKIGSSLCGRILQLDESFEEDYLAKHTRESVKFSELVQSLSAELSGSDVNILEVGPAVTSKLIPAAGSPIHSTFTPCPNLLNQSSGLS